MIVTGKGGTGKTTVAAALGHLAASRGIETAVVEVGHDTALPPLVGGTTPAADKPLRDPQRVGNALHTYRLDPATAFQEYLELQLRIRPLARALVGNAGFRSFLDAAPGWRDLITLGKLWHLESARSQGQPRYGLIVVDAPATGHGLSFLSVPQVILDTVRMGPLRRHTGWVQDLIHDPQRTWVLPVALPEELPVNETIELRARLGELGLECGPVLVNAVEEAPGVAAETATALAELPEAGAPCALVEPRALRATLRYREQRFALQRDHLLRLREQLPGPLVELPFLTDGVDSVDAARELGRALERAPVQVQV